MYCSNSLCGDTLVWIRENHVCKTDDIFPKGKLFIYIP